MGELHLGEGFTLRFASWSPDRKLNPQYNDLPDVDKISAIIKCVHGHEACIHFDSEVARKLGFKPLWTVEQWDPLTLSPSIASRSHECHGFIREGKWVWA